MPSEIVGTFGVACFACGKANLVTREVERRIDHCGQAFVATVAADVCPLCKDAVVDEWSEELMELAAARWLLRHREPTGCVLRLARKVLELTQVELSQLLDLAPETLSRLENGERSMSRQGAALLSLMLTDSMTGDTRTRDALSVERARGEAPASTVWLGKVGIEQQH